MSRLNEAAGVTLLRPIDVQLLDTLTTKGVKDRSAIYERTLKKK